MPPANIGQVGADLVVRVLRNGRDRRICAQERKASRTDSGQSTGEWWHSLIHARDAQRLRRVNIHVLWNGVQVKARKTDTGIEKQVGPENMRVTHHSAPGGEPEISGIRELGAISSGVGSDRKSGIRRRWHGARQVREVVAAADPHKKIVAVGKNVFVAADVECVITLHAIWREEEL